MEEPSIPWAEIPGLCTYWERRLAYRSSPPESWTAEALLLDALGLGLEQTMQYLAQNRPDFAAFTDWITATAGLPDSVTIARYAATLSGVPLPRSVAERLAAVDAMPPVLSDTELEAWDRDGYVVLGQAITPDQVAAAAALLWEITGARPDDPASWYGERTNGLMVQRFQHQALEAARRSPRVHKAFAQLWGTSDLWPRVDRMSFNAPVHAGHEFRAPRLHWDASLVPPIPFATQGILYLADTAEDQGALELVPGFHHRIEAWLAELGDSDPRSADLSAEAIRIGARAGDLIIWRQDLPHGATPNLAGKPRLAQYVNFYSPRMGIQPVWR